MTLIELLLVVAVLAVLMALTLPAIRGSRAAARNTATEATLRQHLTLFGTYLQDYRDTYPWLGKSERGILTLHVPTGEPFTVNYFETCSAWSIAMASYYGDVWPHPSQTYPSRRGGMASYLYSCAMIADPAFWNERTRTGAAQWRATHSTEVTQPARKALLTAAIDREPYPRWVEEGLTIGFCDGGAKFVVKRSLVLPVPSGDGPEAGVFHVRGYYGLDTVDGVRGRDIE